VNHLEIRTNNGTIEGKAREGVHHIHGFRSSARIFYD
jgi:hypothetical protein